MDHVRQEQVGIQLSRAGVHGTRPRVPTTLRLLLRLDTIPFKVVIRIDDANWMLVPSRQRLPIPLITEGDACREVRAQLRPLPSCTGVQPREPFGRTVERRERGGR